MVGAALSREAPLNHILLSGPPGLGKTTLSLILGNEMGTNVSITSGPVIDKPADLAGLLTNLSEEIFYLSMKFTDYRKQLKNIYTQQWKTFGLISLSIKDPMQSVRLNLPKFTLPQCNDSHRLAAAPLEVDSLQTRLDYYDLKTLKGIIERTCDLLG